MPSVALVATLVEPPPPPPVTVTRLVLIRHGQSMATVQGLAGGDRGCGGLTGLGVAQAEALSRRLVATGELAEVAVLVASTLPRAVQTAEVIAPALGDLEIITDREVREMEPGEGDGLTWAEWEERYGSFDVAVEPYRPLSPGGESWADFGLRVGRALERLAMDHAGLTVVVCCHGGVIEQSISHGFGLPAQAPPGRHMDTVPNTSITEWLVDLVPGWPSRWRLVRFADAAHLDADGQPRPVWT